MFDPAELERVFAEVQERMTERGRLQEVNASALSDPEREAIRRAYVDCSTALRALRASVRAAEPLRAETTGAGARHHRELRLAVNRATEAFRSARAFWEDVEPPDGAW